MSANESRTTGDEEHWHGFRVGSPVDEPWGITWFILFD
jgi:hypothetical protein